MLEDNGSVPMDTLSASSCVVDPVIDNLGPPEGVGIVELEQICPLPRILVAPGIYFLVAVSPINGHYLLYERCRGVLQRLFLRLSFEIRKK